MPLFFLLMIDSIRQQIGKTPKPKDDLLEENPQKDEEEDSNEEKDLADSLGAALATLEKPIDLVRHKLLSNT